MSQIDNKYGQVTLEHGEFPDPTEPVFVLRGRDAILPDLLRDYIEMCSAMGTPQRHLDLMSESLMKIDTWQRDHPDQVKMPTSETSRKWRA